jgi:hypothetical protein
VVPAVRANPLTAIGALPSHSVFIAGRQTDDIEVCYYAQQGLLWVGGLAPSMVSVLASLSPLMVTARSPAEEPLVRLPHPSRIISRQPFSVSAICVAAAPVDSQQPEQRGHG